MVRPYAIEGSKRKKKKEENYYKEEGEGEGEEKTVEFAEEDEIAGGSRKKLKADDATASDEEKAEAAVEQLAGIPIALNEQSKHPGIIFILEKASLEVAKVGKTYQLLNSEDHANFLKRNNRNPADYRPDISHQAILMILDSLLNKAGKLKALYVRTEKGVLFEIKPNVRIPRTYKRFAGIMLQLLQKLSISAVGKREKLKRVVKNPVSQYLPINSRRIGFSHSSERLVDMSDYVATVSDDTTLVFLVGAMAHGKIDKENVDDFLSISGYPLSAAYCITRITNALERKMKIL